MRKNPDQKHDDVRPDAQKRFERAVDVALHTRPMHRTAKKKPSPKKRKAKKA